MADRFRCPACGEAFTRGAYAAHLAERPEERRKGFACFVADEEAEPVVGTHCSGALEILPLMDEEEQAGFGIERTACAGTLQRCGCSGTFCQEHTFVCKKCGRFACLRHRWSGTCPACSSGTQSKSVRVEKYDPFSKQRSTFVRRYRRSGGQPPWDRLVPDDPAGPG